MPAPVFTYELATVGPPQNLRGDSGGDATSSGQGTFGVVVDSTVNDNVLLTQFSAGGSGGTGQNILVLEDSAITRMTNGAYAIAGDRDDGVHIWLVNGGVSNRVYTGDEGTSNADVAARTAGGFVVVCEDVVGRGRSGVDVKFYNVSGGLQTEISLTNGVIGSFTDPQVAVLQNGNVAVTWTATASGVREVFYAVYNDAGVQIRAPTRLGSGTNDGSPAITAVGAGFAIAFARVEPKGDNVIGVQAFGATGATSAPLVIVDHDTAALTLPEITAMPDNVLAVSARLSTGGSLVSIVDTAAGRVDPGMVTPGGVVSIIGTVNGRLATVAHGAGELGSQVQITQMIRVGQADDSGVSWTAPDDVATRLTGGGGHDTFIAGNGADVLIGRAGFDDLNGGGGDDRLEGGVGADILRGDSGHDIADYSNAASGIVATLREDATDSNVQRVTNDGDGRSDRLFSIEEIIGSQFKDILTGNGINDSVLRGGGGDDVLTDASGGFSSLFGDAGNDTLDGFRMTGGTGDDTYVIDTGTEIIVEVAGQGIDTVRSAVSFVISNLALENLTLTGSASINATGNAGFNVLTGNAGNNTLDGRAGADRMAGGLGDDTYIVDDAGDEIVEVTGEGTDTVRSSISFAFTGQSLENLILTGSANIDATANSKANVLLGNSGNNILDGKTGADKMTGGLGDDTYVVDNVGDVIVEVTGEGDDTVRSSISFAFTGQSLENLILTGSANINATANSKANIVVGNSGNNVLDGKTGADHMTGGKGDDTYIVDNKGDVIVEVTGQGTDTVKSSISFAFTGQSLENLILTGSANINATANSKANILVGNSGNNILDGKTGVDHMTGGKGDDTYIVDSNSDDVIEAKGEGTDLILSSVSFVMKAGSYVENLTLTGSGNVNATGNGVGNVITGNSGANVLNGAAAADTLIGGAGRDTLTGGTGADRFVFKALSDSVGAGADLITDLSNSDFIDLSAIDGNASVAGVQGFTLVTAFTGASGQMTLAFNAALDTTALSLDVNGDGVADMTIRISGDHDDFDNFIFGGG